MLEWTLENQGNGPQSAELVHEAGFLRTDDGKRLFSQGVTPRTGCRGVVALMHGYNSFSDWMLPMMTDFARAGFACYAADYRGHGLSEGVPCHVYRFEEYLLDISALCRHADEQSGERPLFLMGNSLGGLISSHYAALHPERLEGLILTAPFFGPAFRVPGPLNFCARVASFCQPTRRIPKRHPDLPDHITFRWWTETQRAQALFHARAGLVQAPVLVLHGEKDAVACPRAAKATMERFAAADKTFRLIQGASHADLDPWRGASWWSLAEEWLLART